MFRITYDSRDSDQWHRRPPGPGYSEVPARTRSDRDNQAEGLPEVLNARLGGGHCSPIRSSVTRRT
eukprot:744353-Hanusia_phi.AAC.1